MAVLEACEKIKKRLDNLHKTLREAEKGSHGAKTAQILDNLQAAADEANTTNDAKMKYFKELVHVVRFQYRTKFKIS